MKVLTENFIFMCDSGAGILKGVDASHCKAYSNGSKILTDKTLPVNSGCICSTTGEPCVFVPAGVWQDTSGKMMITISKVLTDRSSISCVLGGTVKAAAGMTKAHINPIPSVEIPSPVAAAAMPVKKAETPSPEIKENKAEKSETPDEKKADKKPEAEKEKTSENKEKTEEKKEAENENKSADEKKPEKIPDFPYALCDYKNCPEWKECEYLKADYSASSINNDSGELKKNFQKAYPEKFNQYEMKTERMNNESEEGSWSTAAHHIISGNQIFAPHSYLVKLANYYGYDINNSENCILLPTVHSFDGKNNIEKQANGYTAMSYMKQQWHVGGHSYVMDENTVKNIRTYLEKSSNSSAVIYKNYVEAVEHEINILESKYKKPSCRKNNFEEKKSRFIENMNRISRKVGGKLLAFENDPKSSFPFYVSNEAVRYAFDIPNKKKFIIIYQDNKSQKIIAEKMSVTRYQKDNYKILFTGADRHIINNSADFIKFAENVRYFICLAPDFSLPWSLNNSREYFINDNFSQNSIDDYCKQNEQKIISFMEGRERGEMNYEPPAKIVKQRLNEMQKV